MIDDILREIGLSEKEIKLYLQLLKLGAQPASVIARKLDIARSTAQFLANNLAKKNMVMRSSKNKITYYAPEKPENIQLFLELKTQKYLNDLKHQKQQIEFLKPFFNKIKNEELHRPKVSFYEGLENVIASYNEFINNMEREKMIYNVVAPASQDYPGFRKGMQEFIKIRAKKKIPCRTICTYSKDAIRLKLTDKKFLRETRIGIKEPANFEFSELLIGSGMVLEVSYFENGIFSSLNYNPIVAHMQSSLFESLWDFSKDYEKEILKRPQVKRWMKELKGIKAYV